MIQNVEFENETFIFHARLLNNVRNIKKNLKLLIPADKTSANNNWRVQQVTY